MGWVSGDVIEIEGKRKTYALLWPGSQSDSGMGIARIDGATRNHAGVGIDDKVVIRKTVASEANRITFAPTEPLRITGWEEELPRLLDGRVLGNGDIISIIVMNSRIDTRSDSNRSGFRSGHNN